MFSSAALIVPVQALAHHSYAMFDLKQNVELVGTVKEWQFTNPHSYLQLVVVENGALHAARGSGKFIPRGVPGPVSLPRKPSPAAGMLKSLLGLGAH